MIFKKILLTSSLVISSFTFYGVYLESGKPIALCYLYLHCQGRMNGVPSGSWPWAQTRLNGFSPNNIQPLFYGEQISWYRPTVSAALHTDVCRMVLVIMLFLINLLILFSLLSSLTFPSSSICPSSSTLLFLCMSARIILTNPILNFLFLDLTYTF